MRQAIVFAGGDAPLPRLARLLPADVLVLAADSGLEQALALGRAVDVVVGDLDSVDRAALDAAVASGAVIERHPSEKDATDLDLALDACRTRGVTRVTVVGGHGGRLDHFAANLLLLASPRYESLDLDAWMGEARVIVVRGVAHIKGAPGSLCTLLAPVEPAHGVTTDGLRYPLRDAVLSPGSTLGVSNVLDAPVATVSLSRGTLLVVQPTALVDSQQES